MERRPNGEAVILFDIAKGKEWARWLIRERMVVVVEEGSKLGSVLQMENLQA